MDRISQRLKNLWFAAISGLNRKRFAKIKMVENIKKIVFLCLSTKKKEIGMVIKLKPKLKNQ